MKVHEYACYTVQFPPPPKKREGGGASSPAAPGFILGQKPTLPKEREGEGEKERERERKREREMQFWGSSRDR